MIINGNDPDYTANGIVLLWENPDLSVPIELGSFIELDVDKYSSLFVEAVYSTRTQSAYGVINITENDWSKDEGEEGDESPPLSYVPSAYPVKCHISLVESMTTYNATCSMRVTNNGISFGDVTAIPYRIYGSYYV